MAISSYQTESSIDSSSSMQNNEAVWSPSSWVTKPIKQKPIYNDHAKLANSILRLTKLPPIVQPKEILKLKSELKKVALGQAFLLQGGDCAELFEYCEQNAIEAKMKLLLQLSMILTYGANKPVVRIGRIAGQYAKPRSCSTELVNGKEIPSFRGDILNGHDINERTLNPERLVEAYFHSASTLNYIRGAISSGFADLRHPFDWELGHVQDSVLKLKYSKIVNSIRDSLRFMQTIGADRAVEISSVDLYTSHEGLLLEYEQALTRLIPNSYNSHKSSPEQEHEKFYFDTSAHFLWIGDRTRQVDGAHVEYFRGIVNPLGIKIGPSTSSPEILILLKKLNPSREIGKITLITRYGASKVAMLLPTHIRAVEDSEYKRCVVWQCDPMHGNTITTASGIKTRRFCDIFSELQQSIEIHKQQGSYLGGIHLELTGDKVTECTGGSDGLVDEDLSNNYTSFCDPRLNENQTLEMGFLVAEYLQEISKSQEKEVQN
ncbi:Phospho-2-dehydro-3-deoxyheptonate aldolase [Golovinomyces cichoracearum]|uniref:Phospho-2-dehydro-3-deoxyheptonate aldolase n=1 Tax=Golovinomyces cichoracearum TaxID=62708 RepID=A0A420IDS4_9PEZI|nr:Phospho-2-dehydro-3-deoxyheptonate aldolase [Golovinomyces cichoracearum]